MRGAVTKSCDGDGDGGGKRRVLVFALGYELRIQNSTWSHD
jgi:hypothetical protein